MNNYFEKLEQLLKLAAKDSITVTLVPSNENLIQGYLGYYGENRIDFSNKYKKCEDDLSVLIFPIDLIIDEWDWFITKLKTETVYRFQHDCIKEYYEHTIWNWCTLPFEKIDMRIVDSDIDIESGNIDELAYTTYDNDNKCVEIKSIDEQYPEHILNKLSQYV